MLSDLLLVLLLFFRFSQKHKQINVKTTYEKTKNKEQKKSKIALVNYCYIFDVINKYSTECRDSHIQISYRLSQHFLNRRRSLYRKADNIPLVVGKSA